MNILEIIKNYALEFLGTPYKWGGSNPIEGFDCSGFVQEVLSAVGIDPRGDQTAQALYEELTLKKWPSHLAEGSILFFGPDRLHITHVAIAFDDKLMIEAGGGNSKTTSREMASQQNAFVRIRPIRKDLVAVLQPEVKSGISKV